jgi:hypothetical protein
VLTQVSAEVKAELDRSGLTERLGEDAFHPAIGDVVDAFASRRPGSVATSSGPT